MSERKSRWNSVVFAIVIFPILYWASAAPTLWVTKKNESASSGMIVLPPSWWSTFYAPVLWAADRPTLGPITIKPFEWLNVDGEVYWELFFHWHHGTVSIDHSLPPLKLKRKTTDP